MLDDGCSVIAMLLYRGQAEAVERGWGEDVELG